jgi:hypothetical protein
VPTHEDIIRSRIRTGIRPVDTLVKTSFSWRFMETGGEMNERRALERRTLRRRFKRLTAIVFVVALPDYNRDLAEEPRLVCNVKHHTLLL